MLHLVVLWVKQWPHGFLMVWTQEMQSHPLFQGVMLLLVSSQNDYLRINESTCQLTSDYFFQRCFFKGFHQNKINTIINNIQLLSLISVEWISRKENNNYCGLMSVQRLSMFLLDVWIVHKSSMIKLVVSGLWVPNYWGTF